MVVTYAQMLQNLIAVLVIGWISFLIWSNMKTGNVKNTMEKLKGMFGGDKSE